MSTLEGKVAIVAGGARDIGRAVSEALAARGAKVVVNYFNNEADGEATVAAIEAAGGTAAAAGARSRSLKPRTRSFWAPNAVWRRPAARQH